MRYNNEEFVKYRIDKDSIVFWTSDINENISAAKVLNEFLYDFSKGKPDVLPLEPVPASYEMYNSLTGGTAIPYS